MTFPNMYTYYVFVSPVTVVVILNTFSRDRYISNYIYGYASSVFNSVSRFCSSV